MVYRPARTQWSFSYAMRPDALPGLHQHCFHYTHRRLGAESHEHSAFRGRPLVPLPDLGRPAHARDYQVYSNRRSLYPPSCQRCILAGGG